MRSDRDISELVLHAQRLPPGQRHRAVKIVGHHLIPAAACSPWLRRSFRRRGAQRSRDEYRSRARGNLPDFHVNPPEELPAASAAFAGKKRATRPSNARCRGSYPGCCGNPQLPHPANPVFRGSSSSAEWKPPPVWVRPTSPACLWTARRLARLAPPVSLRYQSAAVYYPAAKGRRNDAASPTHRCRRQSGGPAWPRPSASATPGPCPARESTRASRASLPSPLPNRPRCGATIPGSAIPCAWSAPPRRFPARCAVLPGMPRNSWRDFPVRPEAPVFPPAEPLPDLCNRILVPSAFRSSHFALRRRHLPPAGLFPQHLPQAAFGLIQRVLRSHLRNIQDGSNL